MYMFRKYFIFLHQREARVDRKLSPFWTVTLFVNPVRKDVTLFLFPEEYKDLYGSVLVYGSSDFN